MNKAVALGLTALAGAAVIEAALIPGLVIGGAAVLAPRLLPNIVPDPLPAFRRQLGSLFGSAAPSPAAQAASSSQTSNAPLAAPNLQIKKAVAKTITFPHHRHRARLHLESGGDRRGPVPAAGLSTFALVVGPLFYLGHEAAWNYFGGARK